MRDNFKAFTLVELMIVLIIISILIGFAVGSYTRAGQKNTERATAAQLRALAGVSTIYKARNNGYWDVGGTVQNEAALQAQFGTDISIDNSTLTYNSSSPDSFAFYAVSTRYGYTARIDILNTPCCQAGTCLNLPACNCGSYILCNTMCVDILSDRGNCNACDTSCGAGQECVAGSCV